MLWWMCNCVAVCRQWPSLARERRQGVDQVGVVLLIPALDRAEHRVAEGAQHVRLEEVEQLPVGPHLEPAHHPLPLGPRAARADAR